ncbi:MAG: elongation factor P maturation arginine rhamnosyltransferase EarP [Burkholderiales bacterium]
MKASHTADIFCKVVDNYGDVGVAWRLTRQLESEQGFNVRFWVDNLATLAQICAEVDAAKDRQNVGGIEIRRWSIPFPESNPAEIVIETFGCNLPENYVIAMAHRAHQPAWINLDYLSAENWIDSHHMLPSPHPRLALTKYYFFPGFTDQTGGLLRERDLLVRRDAFQQDKNAHAILWHKLGVPPPAQGELRVSLFCYENPGLPELLQSWSTGRQPITCLVPDGVARESVAKFFAGEICTQRKSLTRGQLTVHTIPFTNQDKYDLLLWACDVNFVRGEDSFVRAQWAARPFVWHIYPQQENAHWVKLNAFIDLYVTGMPAEHAAAVRDFWRAFNAGRGAGAAWDAFADHFIHMDTYNRKWSAQLASRTDLASGLAEICRKLIK